VEQRSTMRDSRPIHQLICYADRAIWRIPDLLYGGGRWRTRRKPGREQPRDGAARLLPVEYEGSHGCQHSAGDLAR